jgi:tetratricopeptide (TPR) repeat protein
MCKYIRIHFIILICMIIATELTAMGGPEEGGSRLLKMPNGTTVEMANRSPDLVPGLSDNWYHYNQGIIDIKWKNWDQARKEFDYYLNNPDMHSHMFGVAHFGKALMFQAMSNPGQALAEYKMAVENDRHPALKIADRAYVNMGAIYFKQKAYAEAVAAYSKAVESNPKNGSAHYWLGMSYLRNGESEKAEKEAEEARKLGIPFTALANELSAKKNASATDTESADGRANSKNKKKRTAPNE